MLSLTRVECWPDRLVETIERHRSAPFVWGKTDCARLFSEAVLAVTGVDPLADYPPWSSEAEAAEILSVAGYATMKTYCDAHFPSIAVAEARRGDLVMPEAIVPLMCPAVVVGAMAVSRDVSGWAVMPLDLMTRAWRVG